jgi:hypothetical protein
MLEAAERADQLLDEGDDMAGRRDVAPDPERDRSAAAKAPGGEAAHCRSARHDTSGQDFPDIVFVSGGALCMPPGV